MKDVIKNSDVWGTNECKVFPLTKFPIWK